MNLDELRSVQATERQKDSLQHLRDSFYEDVSAYISEREAERASVAADVDDPFSSPEVRQLTDEIETARSVTEAIYDRRLGKLLKRASLAAADVPIDEDGLTAEERDLFSGIVDCIESNKAHVLDVVEGEEPPTGPEELGTDRSSPPRPDEGEASTGGDSGSTADGAPDESVRTAADAMGDDGDVDESDTQHEGGDAADDVTDRTTVRITRDVGEIFGVDEREYDLSSETVVTLPTENAEPLLQRGAAERIE